MTDNFKLGEVDDQRTMTELESTSSTGLEALLIMDARLSRYVNLDSEFDLLMTSRDRADWFFTWENRLRIALTSFINLALVADLERNQTLDDTQGREQVLLRFSRQRRRRRCRAAPTPAHKPRFRPADRAEHRRPHRHRWRRMGSTVAGRCSDARTANRGGPPSRISAGLL